MRRTRRCWRRCSRAAGKQRLGSRCQVPSRGIANVALTIAGSSGWSSLRPRVGAGRRHVHQKGAQNAGCNPGDPDGRPEEAARRAGKLHRRERPVGGGLAGHARPSSSASARREGPGGHEVHVEPGARRLSNIFNKTDAFDRCLAMPEVLAAAHYLLGEIKVHGANLRDPVKGYGQQDLHVDVPKKFADDWWVVNAMIMFDDMTLDNGPTRVVPGSHHWAPINVPTSTRAIGSRSRCRPKTQARVPEDLARPIPGEVLSRRRRARRSSAIPRCGTAGPEERRCRTGACCISPTRAATCRSSWCSSIT